MATEIGVLVVHGIGIQKPDFADEFISEMDDRLAGHGIAHGTVKWEPAYWADLLNDREKKLYDATSSHPGPNCLDRALSRASTFT